MNQKANPKKKNRTKIFCLILIAIIIITAIPLINKINADKDQNDYWQKTEKEAVNGEYIDWDALGENCVAYFKMDDIQYPVMQGKNNKYYLHHRPDGSYNYAGSLFLYAQNSSDFTDKNSFIFGHNMYVVLPRTNPKANMFGTLKMYKSPGYKDHTFVLYLPDGTKHTYQFYSVVHCRYNDKAYTYQFNGDSDFLQYEKYMKKRSMYENSTTADENSHLVTLSTCDGRRGTKNRLLIQGVEVKVKKTQEPASWYKAKTDAAKIPAQQPKGKRNAK